MPQKNLKPVRKPKTLQLFVQDSIRDYIFENQLQPGAPLPSVGQLAEQLEVGRSSGREAVKALELAGIVESRVGSGLFVGSFSLDPLLDSLPYNLVSDLQELNEILEIRRVLEIGMIKDVIEKLTPEQIGKLEENVATMKAFADQDKKFPAQDRKFHQFLFENLHNKTLLKLLDVFWLTFNKYQKYVDVQSVSAQILYERHLAILNAVKARDVDAAAAALADHYQYFLNQSLDLKATK